MQIGITNPLRSFLRWKPFSPNAEELPLFCWDAHRVKIDGRVMLVVCNAANRFAGIMAMRAADWKYLDETCRNLIAATMRESGFSQEAIDQYFMLAGPTEFGRTHGPKPMGCMNRMIDLLMFERCDRNEQFQAGLAFIANYKDLGKCACHEGYGHARERMAKDLAALGIRPIEEVCNVAECLNLVGDDDVPQPTKPSQPTKPADDKLMREIDETTLSSRIVRPDSPPRASAKLGVCSVCGAGARVFVGGVPYCLDCYNEMTENLIGVPHVTNDSVVLPIRSKKGIVRFQVQRMLTPPIARWTAREVVTGDDPDYEGISVCVDASAYEDQDLTLSRLRDKVREAVTSPSTRPYSTPAGFGGVANGAHVGGEIRFAEASGWCRIEDDEQGQFYVVVDGRRYDGEQFLRLFSGNVGFDLHWQIHDAGDALPSSRP